MATKSIMKCVNIKRKKDCQTLLHALECAKKTHVAPVTMQRPSQRPDDEQIKKMFLSVAK